MHLKLTNSKQPNFFPKVAFGIWQIEFRHVKDGIHQPQTMNNSTGEAAVIQALLSGWFVFDGWPVNDKPLRLWQIVTDYLTG